MGLEEENECDDEKREELQGENYAFLALLPYVSFNAPYVALECVSGSIAEVWTYVSPVGYGLLLVAFLMVADDASQVERPQCFVLVLSHRSAGCSDLRCSSLRVL